MPPRKKNASAPASNPGEATRRSTRNTKKYSPTPILTTLDSSEDEISSTRANVSVATGTEDSQQDEPGDTTTVRTTRSKSHASSRPSTANSNGVSQPGVISTPATNKDVMMIDVSDDEGEDELSGQGPALKKTKSVKNTPTSARKSRSKYDNPDEMLTNPRAPLAKVNLRDLLCSSKAWDVLSPEEKKSVLDKFPDEKEVLDAGTENARPDIAALRNNDNFRHDAARYQEDLRKGWHDPEWIRQAQAAHRRRALGDYNEYLAARFEEDWGIPMPKQRNGENNEIGNDILKDGDNDSDDDPGAMQGVETNERDQADKEGPENEDKVLKDGREHPPDTVMAL
ncbi:Asx homology domain-containing protein [Annulohypoxylon truncatum]|uniref:Asx homology domain-containing protein n=1 Tax=Annulohypoxylon truncatum TaxID=327061 RepID=UPI0020072465|nr:Asx homology domain-containing protein [Annulohypoxylon truncatum]KAI1214835.1 Asx homology domain-containing protein [Annulohypoxylon truncatum]